MDAADLPESLRPFAKFISGYGTYGDCGHCSVYLEPGWQFNGVITKHSIVGYTPRSTAEYFSCLKPCNCADCLKKLDAAKPQIGNLVLTTSDQLIEFLKARMSK